MRTPSPGAGSGQRGRTAVVGAVAGATSGLFGVGGGIVMVPALMALARFHPKLAAGTSLSAAVPISLSGAIGYASAGQIDWAAALAVAAGSLAGALAGTHLLRRIDPTALQLLLALVMVGAAARMLLGSGDGAGRAELGLAGAAAMVALGVGAGVLAGLLGIGGGILVIPVLTIGFGLPLATAKGTSLAVIVPTAVAATVRNRAVGLTALGPAAVAGGAGALTALVTARISVALDPALAAGLFAAFLVVVAARLARTAWRDRREG